MDDTTMSEAQLPPVSQALQEPTVAPAGAAAMQQRAPARGYPEAPSARPRATRLRLRGLSCRRRGDGPAHPRT